MSQSTRRAEASAIAARPSRSACGGALHAGQRQLGTRRAVETDEDEVAALAASMTHEPCGGRVRGPRAGRSSARRSRRAASPRSSPVRREGHNLALHLAAMG